MSFILTLLCYIPLTIFILAINMDRETNRVILSTDKAASEIKDILLENGIHEGEEETVKISMALSKYSTYKNDNLKVLVNEGVVAYDESINTYSYTNSKLILFLTNFIVKQERRKLENSLLPSTYTTLEKTDDNHWVNKITYDVNHEGHQDRIIITRNLTEIYAKPLRENLLYGGLSFIFLCAMITIISYITQVMKLKEFEQVVEEQQRVLIGVGPEKYVNVGRKHGELFEKVSDVLINIHVHAQETSAANKNLIQDISHETSFYLTQIKQSIDSMRYFGIEDKEQIDKMLSKIETATFSIKDIQNAFIDLAILENSERIDKAAFYNVGELINLAVDIVSKQFRNIKFVQTDVGLDKQIHIYRDQFLMIMRTLLENAAKYSEGSDTVMIEILDEPKYEGCVAIKITNWGTSIPEEEREHIFERYYRATNVRGAQHGVGLGLHIAKKFIDQHGGWIEVESSESKETSFTVVLPETRGQKQQ